MVPAFLFVHVRGDRNPWVSGGSTSQRPGVARQPAGFAGSLFCSMEGTDA
jgi:hypothetical protein